MVTYQGLIEFEHTVPKITPASPCAVTMVAGDALIGTRLANETAQAMYGTSPTIAQMAAQLAVNYEAVRNQWVESQILSARGLSFQSFYQGHSTFNGQITAAIDQAMAQFNLGVELLVAGVDATGAHLFTVHNPGRTAREHDVIAFAAIGTGWIHVMQAMIGFRHSPTAPFKETLYRVYAAKRRSEVAPGVGTDTDMGVISLAGIQPLTNEQLGELAELYGTINNESVTILESHLQDLRFDLQPPITPEPPMEGDSNEPDNPGVATADG